MSNATSFLRKSHYAMMRSGLLLGISWVILLVLYTVVRYPAAFTLAPAESVVFLGLFVVLMGVYSWLALRRARATTPEMSLALQHGGWLGLVLGLCWLIELWAGNLADPVANPLVMAAYRGSTLAVPVLIVISSIYSSRQTGLRQTGIWVGVWSGLISALITFTGLMLIAYSGRLLNDAQTIQQAKVDGVTDIMAYGVADSMVGAINHLWIGPVLGLIFGAVGGWIGAVGKN